MSVLLPYSSPPTVWERLLLEHNKLLSKPIPANHLAAARCPSKVLRTWPRACKNR